MSSNTICENFTPITINRLRRADQKVIFLCRCRLRRLNFCLCLRRLIHILIISRRVFGSGGIRCAIKLRSRGMMATGPSGSDVGSLLVQGGGDISGFQGPSGDVSSEGGAHSNVLRPSRTASRLPMRTDETGEGEGEACGCRGFDKTTAGVVFHEGKGDVCVRCS